MSFNRREEHIEDVSTDDLFGDWSRPPALTPKERAIKASETARGYEEAGLRDGIAYRTFKQLKDGTVVPDDSVDPAEHFERQAAAEPNVSLKGALLKHAANARALDPHADERVNVSNAQKALDQLKKLVGHGA